MRSNNKSSFWVFVSSLIPGAGEMYMGLMKMGVTTMTLFFGMFSIIEIFHVSEFAIFLPVVWFYSFFKVHGYKRMSEEEFAKVEDRAIIKKGTWEELSTNKVAVKSLGVLMVLVGSKICLDQFLENVADYIDSNLFWNVFYFLQYDAMRILLAIVIVIVGICLITGKRLRTEHVEE